MTATQARAATYIDPEIPLIDLHRHIDGSVRLTTILELAQKHRVKLPGATVQELRPHVQVMPAVRFIAGQIERDNVIPLRQQRLELLLMFGCETAGV
jgi:Adenosine deaminase